MSLIGKTILITGAARRIGRSLALAVAKAGGEVVLHHGRSVQAAHDTAEEIRCLGSQAHLLQADLSDPAQAAGLVERAAEFGPLFALVNNAAIFEPISWKSTDLAAWQRHLDVNLTAPFLLSKAFALALPDGQTGRIVNLLDWRALHPGPDHLPYTISKAALAALTQSLAQAFAPHITVNGLALGAVLPPVDLAAGEAGASRNAAILERVPAGRWAGLDEVGQALLFLLTGPAYITGEIIHLDGGRHLT